MQRRHWYSPLSPVRARCCHDGGAGTPLDPVPTLLNKLEVKTGDPYDGVVIDAPLAKYVGPAAGAQGYYLGERGAVPAMSSGPVGQSRAERGRRATVEMVFHGDSLTARERDQLVRSPASIPLTKTSMETRSSASRVFPRTRILQPPRDYQRNTAAGVLTIAFTRDSRTTMRARRRANNRNTVGSSEELTPLIRSVVGARSTRTRWERTARDPRVTAAAVLRR